MIYANPKNRRRGFTIVELVVVVVVIGILAAISVVSYNAVQLSAKKQNVRTDVQGMSAALTKYRADNGTFPSDLSALTWTPKSNTSFQYTYLSSTNSYCLTGSTTGYSAYLTNSSGLTPEEGGCPGHGVNGNAPITNIATNPNLELDSVNWGVRWFGSGGSGTSSVVPGIGACGTNAYRKVWTVSGAGYQDIGFSYLQTGITAGKDYTFTAQVRASYQTTHRIFVEWKNSGGTTIGNTYGTSDVAQASTVNQWYTLKHTATAPAGAVSALLVFGPYPTTGQVGNGNAVPVGATVDGDCVLIAQSSKKLEYADGDTTNWIWNGTQNASTSTGPEQ